MSCRLRLIRVLTSKQPCRRLQRCCRGLRHLFPLLLCSTLHLSQRSPSSVEPKRSRCQLRGAFGTYSVRPCANTKTCTSCTGIFEFNFLAASQLAWLTKPGDGINVDIGHCNFHEPATPQIWRQESLLLLYSEVVPNLLERQKHVENLGAWNASLAQSAKLCEGTFKLPKKTHLFIATGKDEKGVSSCFFPSADCFVSEMNKKTYSQHCITMQRWRLAKKSQTLGRSKLFGAFQMRPWSCIGCQTRPGTLQYWWWTTSQGAPSRQTTRYYKSRGEYGGVKPPFRQVQNSRMLLVKGCLWLWSFAIKIRFLRCAQGVLELGKCGEPALGSQGQRGLPRKSSRDVASGMVCYASPSAFRRKVHGAAIETAKREYVGWPSGMRFEVAKLEVCKSFSRTEGATFGGYALGWVAKLWWWRSFEKAVSDLMEMGGIGIKKNQDNPGISSIFQTYLCQLITF